MPLALLRNAVTLPYMADLPTYRPCPNRRLPLAAKKQLATRARVAENRL